MEGVIRKRFNFNGFPNFSPIKIKRFLPFCTSYFIYFNEAQFFQKTDSIYDFKYLKTFILGYFKGISIFAILTHICT